MKKTTTKTLFLLACSVLALASAESGTLDPPGPPSPTMVTLQQIYDRVGGVAKTGQTGCWDATGFPISCGGTGQDGALQRGYSASPRFTDNGDGTVKDNLTGLIWLKNANCWPSGSTWTDALTRANALASGACGLTDGSTAGAWRLPNQREMQSLIDFGQSTPALPPGHPFIGVLSASYWSSTSNNVNPGYAWWVELAFGRTDRDVKTGTNFFVWPVRGGQ